MRADRLNAQLSSVNMTAPAGLLDGRGAFVTMPRGLFKRIYPDHVSALAVLQELGVTIAKKEQSSDEIKW